MLHLKYSVQLQAGDRWSQVRNCSAADPKLTRPLRWSHTLDQAHTSGMKGIILCDLQGVNLHITDKLDGMYLAVTLHKFTRSEFLFIL